MRETPYSDNANRCWTNRVSAFEFPSDQTGVMTAESKRVGERDLDFGLAGGVRDVEQVHAVGVGVVEVDGRGDDSVLDRLDASNQLHSARGTQEVP